MIFVKSFWVTCQVTSEFKRVKICCFLFHRKQKEIYCFLHEQSSLYWEETVCVWIELNESTKIKRGEKQLLLPQFILLV